MKPLCLHDFEVEARARLTPEVYDLFAGGADDELTVRENEAAYLRWHLRPRVLRGDPPADLAVELPGARSTSPIVIAPTGFHRLAHPDGELATARAAARAGVIYIVSMASTTSLDDISGAMREAGGGTWWLQLYLQPDLELTARLVRRAERAGATALVVTVDSPVFGFRRRDLRGGICDLPEGMCCENMRDGGGPARSIVFSTHWKWEHLAWLRSVTHLPVWLKGILHPEDARLAALHGAGGIFVSNHGGRQLDGVPATLDVLAEIADAIAGDVPILLDGGVRRGTDVLKALALGASAIALGRPVLWALAAGGEAGIRRLLELLDEELRRALALCGISSRGDLSPALLRRAGKDTP